MLLVIVSHGGSNLSFYSSQPLKINHRGILHTNTSDLLRNLTKLHTTLQHTTDLHITLRLGGVLQGCMCHSFGLSSALLKRTAHNPTAHHRAAGLSATRYCSAGLCAGWLGPCPCPWYEFLKFSCVLLSVCDSFRHCQTCISYTFSFLTFTEKESYHVDYFVLCIWGGRGACSQWLENSQRKCNPVSVLVLRGV